MSRIYIYWTTFWLLLFVLAMGSAKVGAEESGAREIPWQLAQKQTPWYNDADQTFRLGRGMGRQLMTQQEWREHQQKMRGMSVEERNRYRKEWHNKLMQRARQKGIGMPDTPGPSRGSGTGQGMGHGGGMGGGGRR
jgi:hypothetical protein